MEFDLEDPLSNFKEEQTFDNDIAQLFASESDHMPSPIRLSSTHFRVSFHCKAISLILEVQLSSNLDPFVAYLAINYLQRFMSNQEIPQGKAWFLRLLVISCISLASKMKNTTFSFFDMKKEGCNFEAKSIQRMELLILGALNWRMRSITPFSFLHFFISLAEVKDQPLKQALKDRASEIIFNAQNDMKLLEYKPSTIAATALIFASNELYPQQYSILRASIAACEYLNEEVPLGDIAQMLKFDARDGRDGSEQVNDRREPFKYRNSRVFWREAPNGREVNGECCRKFLKLRDEEAEREQSFSVHKFYVSLFPILAKQERATRP